MEVATINVELNKDMDRYCSGAPFCSVDNRDGGGGGGVRGTLLWELLTKSFSEHFKWH